MATFTLHIDTLILPAIILKIVSQSCLGQPLAIWLAKGALRDKSWRETIFKIMAGRINVSICNVVFPFVFLQSDTWYYCPYCPKGYSYKHHLQRHLLVHSAIKPYNCEQCDFSTTRIDSLKRHILNNHNGAAGLPSALQ